MVSDSPQQLASWVDLQFASACTPCIISTDFYARRCKGAEIAAAEKAARDAQAKADAIDAAVYDLKAVNPRGRRRRHAEHRRDHRVHRV